MTTISEDLNSGVSEQAKPVVGKSKSEYLGHIHNFRGLAIFLIVATHCVTIFNWRFDARLGGVLTTFFANGTIFFLFIAGYLFQHLSGRFKLLTYYQKKFKFVVLPYLVCSIPALFYFTLFEHRLGISADFYDKSVFVQVVLFLVSGRHVSPFWYIPVIVLFYFFSPLFVYLDKRPKILYGFLPFLILIPLFVPRGDYNPLQSFVHFLPIWVLGMACSHYREQASNIIKRFFWLLLSCAIFLFVMELGFVQHSHSWISDFQKTLVTLVLYEVFRRFGGSVDWLFSRAGTLSFGIFFFHSYVISFARLAVIHLYGQVPGGGLFVFVLISIVATYVTIGLVDLTRRGLGRSSRMVIGV